ncbi:sensor histidine kinase [Sutcliffiella horikoshii]|uniref:sensor histidine kinase n=1 Tax=Sutcliffiella horikoshii TaxID=79883 RepID=UPI00203E8DB6|nr:sensor histidine kinase [Sutcliffiella horikoshii]
MWKRVEMMIQKVIKNSFARKVVLSILLVVFISTIFNSFFFYQSASNIVKENVRESSLQIARQAADSLSYIFSMGSDTSDILYSNERLQGIVMEDTMDLSVGDRNSNNEYITSLLNSFVYSSSFVQNIYVLKESDSSWGSGTFSLYKLRQYNLLNQDWAKEAILKDGQLVWKGLQFDQLSGVGQNTELVVTINRVLKDFNNLENIGFIQVGLDGRVILEKIDQIKLGKTGRFFVVNEEGVVMVDSVLENIQHPVRNDELFAHIQKDQLLEFEFDQNGTAYYGVKQPISNGWTIVGIVPVQEITGELNSIQVITILTTSIFGIVAIIIGLLAANRVTKPIKVLTQQMKLVGEGNFNVRTKVESTDEIGMMSKQFNQMINEVDKLLEQVKEVQGQKQKAELRAIKHRINPHFLFNTLSTIRWLMKLNQNEKADTAMSALIKLLEANMGKKGTFVTLNEELNIVEKFMSIMKIRYEQEFYLELDIEREIEDFLIPQMLIQPIVENSIFHGFVPTGKDGTIQITGRRMDDGIILEISDNGVGVKEEALEKIQTQTANSFVGIGLLHVYDSVNLYYETGSKVEIESNGNGTTVRMILKRKGGGEALV